MPSAEVEFHHGHKSLEWIINIRHWQQRLRVCHEAINHQNAVYSRHLFGCLITHLVILSSILLGSNMKVGRTTRLRSAPGRSCEMICESTAHFDQPCISLLPIRRLSPFPCSGSTTVVSSSGPSDLDSSWEPRSRVNSIY